MRCASAGSPAFSEEPGAVGDVAVLVLGDLLKALEVAGQDALRSIETVWKYWPVSASVPR